MCVFYASVNIISIVLNIPRMSSQHPQHHQQIGFPHLMVKVRIRLKDDQKIRGKESKK